MLSSVGRNDQFLDILAFAVSASDPSQSSTFWASGPPIDHERLRGPNPLAKQGKCHSLSIHREGASSLTWKQLPQPILRQGGSLWTSATRSRKRGVRTPLAGKGLRIPMVGGLRRCSGALRCSDHGDNSHRGFPRRPQRSEALAERRPYLIWGVHGGWLAQRSG